MKREELKVYKLFGSRTSSSRFIDMYFKSEADEVMDAMEKQIRILENDKEEMYDANLVLQARIKELEAQLENVQSSMYAENVDANMALVKANERIKELEAENARLKAMKWISVDDVKPQWGKEVKVKFKDGSEDEVRFSHDHKWVSKGMATCESSEVTHWMPLPTTEESSVTEKENW